MTRGISQTTEYDNSAYAQYSKEALAIGQETFDPIQTSTPLVRVEASGGSVMPQGGWAHVEMKRNIATIYVGAVPLAQITEGYPDPYILRAAMVDKANHNDTSAARQFLSQTLANKSLPNVIAVNFINAATQDVAQKFAWLLGAIVPFEPVPVGDKPEGFPASLKNPSQFAQVAPKLREKIKNIQADIPAAKQAARSTPAYKARLRELVAVGGPAKIEAPKPAPVTLIGAYATPEVRRVATHTAPEIQQLSQHQNPLVPNLMGILLQRANESSLTGLQIEKLLRLNCERNMPTDTDWVQETKAAIQFMLVRFPGRITKQVMPNRAVSYMWRSANAAARYDD